MLSRTAIFILFIMLTVVFAGCQVERSETEETAKTEEKTDSGGTTTMPQSPESQVDPTTGFSRETIKAQVNAGIYSPYQLIQFIEPSVSTVMVQMEDPYIQPGTSSEEQLRLEIQAAVQNGLNRLDPNLTESVKAELIPYLVNYFMKQI